MHVGKSNLTWSFTLKLVDLVPTFGAHRLGGCENEHLAQSGKTEIIYLHGEAH